MRWCCCCEDHDWYNREKFLDCWEVLEFSSKFFTLNKVLLHQTFLGVWKSCDQPMPGSFLARLFLDRAKPWEWGWSLCQLFPFILATRVLVLCITRGWFSSPESEVVALLGTRLPGLRSSLKEQNGCFLFLSGMASSIREQNCLSP